MLLSLLAWAFFCQRWKLKLLGRHSMGFLCLVHRDSAQPAPYLSIPWLSWAWSSIIWAFYDLYHLTDRVAHNQLFCTHVSPSFCTLFNSLLLIEVFQWQFGYELALPHLRAQSAFPKQHQRPFVEPSEKSSGWWKSALVDLWQYFPII